MLVTLSGIVIDVNLLQPSNAELPMLVTLFGMVREVIAVLSLKQFSHISLTVFPESVVGTVTTVTVPKYLISATDPSFFSTYSQSAFCCENPEAFHIVLSCLEEP